MEGQNFRSEPELLLRVMDRCPDWCVIVALVGGGHTVAAVQELGLADKMSYISTAGGALIEFLMGKKLPDVVALEKSRY
jgi:3-phosphoglycerate kinase